MANLKVSRKRAFISKAPHSSPPAFFPSSPYALSPEDLSPPVPESDLSAYTPARLGQSISYARTVLTWRDISPRSEEFLTHYQNEMTVALNATTQVEKVECFSVVRILKVLLVKNYFLRSCNSLEMQETDLALIELREFQYFNRYGDYIKILLNQIRQCASKNQLTNWEEISGRHQWSSIAEALVYEKNELMKKAMNMTTSKSTELKYLRHMPSRKHVSD
jgi:hypothetical protein